MCEKDEVKVNWILKKENWQNGFQCQITEGQVGWKWNEAKNLIPDHRRINGNSILLRTKKIPKIKKGHLWDHMIVNLMNIEKQIVNWLKKIHNEIWMKCKYSQWKWIKFTKSWDWNIKVWIRTEVSKPKFTKFVA